MEVVRGRFQGLGNIVRFNWHFYVISIAVLLAVLLGNHWYPTPYRTLVSLATIFAIGTIAVSLLVSHIVYDLSDLYALKWLGNLDNQKILNISAGFDETSTIIENSFHGTTLAICDFYDPKKHTEVSIKRARKAYPPHPDTISVQTDLLPFPDNTFHTSLVILSAHEIREERERIQFFKELGRITKNSGQIMVTEHLRDLNNFLAYSIGFMHFHSKTTWMETFGSAGLSVHEQIRTTPFITTFILKTNGNTF